MQFKVPQFLDIEDKIFGPFTFKEFVYLAGGAGLCFVIYRLLGLVLGVIPILAVAGFSLALTFYRPNNKPFINMIEAGFGYFSQSKLYIWKRRQKKITDDKLQTTNEGQKREMMGSGARLGGNKLRDLAWSLDVLDINKHKNTDS
jgi:PrgI family protein